MRKVTRFGLWKTEYLPTLDFLVKGTHKNEQKASYLGANTGQFVHLMFAIKKVETSQSLPLPLPNTHTPGPIPLSPGTEMHVSDRAREPFL